MTPAPSRVLAARLAVTWLCLLAGAYVIGTILTDAGWRWDQQLVDALHAPVTGGASGPMKTFTTLGSPLVLDAVFAAALIGLLAAHRRRAALFVALASPGTVLLVAVTKVLVHRTRPAGLHLTHADGSSWPSGHAAGAAALYGALLLIAVRGAPDPRRGRAIAGVGGALIALVGFSRVLLGVHYLSDVVAAWILSAAWLAVLHRWQLAPSPQPGTPPPPPPKDSNVTAMPHTARGPRCPAR